MRLLPDTHILLWTIAESRRLSAAARALIGEPDNELTFSSASLWEIAIKTGLGRADFRIDVSALRRNLSTTVMPNSLDPPCGGAGGSAAIYKDPFDRMLVAQAIVEGFTLLVRSDGRQVSGTHSTGLTPDMGRVSVVFAQLSSANSRTTNPAPDRSWRPLGDRW